jgi:hypothetical protein
VAYAQEDYADSGEFLRAGHRREKIFDRGRLAYLNVVEKMGCVYCSYANGLLAFVTEIAARTEQHFCPIRHDRRSRQPHSRYPHFLPDGDALAYRRRGEEVSRAYGDLDVKP